MGTLNRFAVDEREQKMGDGDAGGAGEKAECTAFGRGGGPSDGVLLSNG